MKNPFMMQSFGATANGEEVALIRLENETLACEVLTYGATLRALFVPDRTGKPVDVVLGYDTLQEYVENDGYLGAVVGRFANRIAKGHFSLNGSDYTLAVNNGPNHLHGGLVGFSHRVWKVEGGDASHVILSLTSFDGEEGYPGNLTVQVTYTLTGSTLSVDYHATSDADTVCNLTNHSYFNLTGHDSGLAMEQEIALSAERYTPSNADSIPFGTMEPVEGTPMDLRKAVKIGAHINEPFLQLQQGNGYDHNYVVDGMPGTLRPAAKAFSPATGILMQVHTTQPGMQFYTANFLNEGLRGKNGCAYGPRHAFCLETQHFPDSPNQPQFPSVTLWAGEEYTHRTEFVFSNADSL